MALVGKDIGESWRKAIAVRERPVNDWLGEDALPWKLCTPLLSPFKDQVGTAVWPLW